MKANEFIKREGLEEARFLLDEWDGVTTNWSLEDGFVYVGSSVDTHMLCLETLKRLVESHELVESLVHTYKDIGIVMEKASYCGCLECKRRLKAIAEVESCQ